MLINIRKKGIHPKGVIHVGASTGQEYDTYLKMGIAEKNITFIEAHPDTYLSLLGRLGHTKCTLVHIAAGSKIGKSEMYCSKQNEGQSNSLLKPKLHLKQHPDIKFTYKVTVDVLPLDIIISNPPNFLVCDCQGMEGEILKGATETIKKLDYIYLEVNRGEVYEGNILVDEIDKMLSDFVRVETKWVGLWGDALYVRSNKL